MSPVSRGRGKKNRSSKGPRAGRAPVRRLAPPGGEPHAWSPPGVGLGVGDRSERHPQRSAVDAVGGIGELLPGWARMTAESRSWWPDSHVQVLDAAAGLLGCAGPDELDDAVCDLLGRHWRGLYEAHEAGLAAREWLEGLVDAADGRAGEAGVRRLLYGIALIAAPSLAGFAVDVLSHAPTGAHDQEPVWLGVPPTLTASADVLMLRDAYGLRFGLLAQVSGPSGQPRTYLFDVDLCHGFQQVLDSGYHPDTAAATAAWRGLVGSSAASAEPEPATDDLLAHVLPGAGLIDGLFTQPLSDSHFTELYRGDRMVGAITDALAAAGRPLAWPAHDPQQASALAASLCEQFKAWAAHNHIELPPSPGPDEDVVTWLLHDWVNPGMPTSLALACSPHRIGAFTAYLNDDWRDEQRAQALAVLVPWVRFCLEHTGLTGQPAQDVLAWADRAARDPAAVGAELGNNLNRRIDETTVTGPPLPAHTR